MTKCRDSAGFKHRGVDHRVVVFSCFGPEEKTVNNVVGSQSEAVSGVTSVITFMMTHR